MSNAMAAVHRAMCISHGTAMQPGNVTVVSDHGLLSWSRVPEQQLLSGPYTIERAECPCSTATDSSAPAPYVVKELWIDSVLSGLTVLQRR